MIKKVVRNRKSTTNIANVAMKLEEDSTFSKSSFLIIDDFMGMRSMLTSVLRGCGASAGLIDTAGSAGEALGMLSNKRYDVVLCDYN